MHIIHHVSQHVACVTARAFMFRGSAPEVIASEMVLPRKRAANNATKSSMPAPRWTVLTRTGTCQAWQGAAQLKVPAAAVHWLKL